MRSRCLNHNDPNWKRYGARGIKVCERWQSFENFLADMGERPAGTSLDRINNDGNYEPGNCRWATCQQQMQNLRTNRNLTYQGRTLPLNTWAREVGLSSDALWRRIARGWPVDMALQAPASRCNRLVTLRKKA